MVQVGPHLPHCWHLRYRHKRACSLNNTGAYNSTGTKNQVKAHTCTGTGIETSIGNGTGTSLSLHNYLQVQPGVV